MLEAARLVTTVYDGTVTEVLTSNAIKDSNCHERVDTFKNGTLIMTSGSAFGAVYDILNYSEGVFVLGGSVSGSASAGDTYSAIYPDFSRNMLRSACIAGIREILVPHVSNEQVVNGVCTLSDGVSNVKSVKVGQIVNYHWEERGGKLYFDDSSLTDDITVVYAKPYDVSGESTTIPPYIDPIYVWWSAAVILWRNKIQMIMKDNPSAVEMLNEAKANLDIALSRASRYSPLKIMRDARMVKY